MARHRDDAAAAGGRAGTIALIVAAVLVLGLVAFVLRGALGGEDPQASTAPVTTTQSSTTPTTSTATTTAETSSETSEETTSQTTTSSSSTTTEVAGPPAELEACVAEVSAGEDLAGAVANSADHWRAHYGASESLHEGDITLVRAKQIWADSRAEGPGDVEAYDAAKAAYDGAAGGCADLEGATLPPDFEAAATDCQERAAAVAGIAEAGAGVNGDWAAHLEMMAAKEETDPEAYLEEWLHDVDTAPSNMSPLREAQSALRAAPACSLDG